MREVDDLARWISERRRHARLVAEIASAPKQPRRKPRTADEHAMLERAALNSIERSRVEGRIVKLGPRRYALHSPEPRA